MYWQKSNRNDAIRDPRPSPRPYRFQFCKFDVPNGMKMFDRAPIKTAMEGDFDTGNVRYKARERYSFGVSDPRGIFGSPGA